MQLWLKADSNMKPDLIKLFHTFTKSKTDKCYSTDTYSIKDLFISLYFNKTFDLGIAVVFFKVKIYLRRSKV